MMTVNLRSHRLFRRISLAAAVCLACLRPLPATEKVVSESEREIPVAYDVDVVVVGGSSAGVAATVAAAEQDYSGLGVIMAAEDRSLPMMRERYRSATTSAQGRLRCAHVLGMLGDATGVETLIATVRDAKTFDDQRIDTYFPWVTWLDSYLIALGRTGDARALEPLLEKLMLLGQGSGDRVSHYRAIALALEALRDPAAAEPLGQAMKTLEIQGMAATDSAGLTAGQRSKSGQRDLTLARVLYRLGDHEGIGKRILEQYTRDICGHYARHAQAVLAEGPF